MADTFSEGWTKHDRCGSDAWQYAIKGPFSLLDVPIIVVVCGKCDRYTCPECQKIDWTGKLTECCGKPIDLKTFLEEKKKKEGGK